MAIRHIWKASLLTAFLVLAPIASADDSSNAEDDLTNTEDQGPCDVIVIGLQAPYVDLHPECVPDITRP